MEIFMNGEKLDFSLEHEKHLGQLAANFEQWTSRNGHFIDSLRVDDRELTLEQALESSLSLNDIARIDFSVKGRLDQIEEMIPMVNNYLNQFIQAAAGGKESFCLNKREKIEGLAWITDSISLVAQNLGIPAAHIFYEGRNLEEVLNFFRLSVSQLSRFVHDSDFFYQYIQEGIAPRLLSLKKLFSLLIAYYNYLLHQQNPDFKNGFLNEIPAIKSTLEEVPSALQDGRDQDAVSLIQKAFSFFQSFFALLAKTPLSESDQKRVSEIKTGLSESLEMVYQSFKDRDIVSVSDMMEYELTEKLEELAEIFKNA